MWRSAGYNKSSAGPQLPPTLFFLFLFRSFFFSSPHRRFPPISKVLFYYFSSVLQENKWKNIVSRFSLFFFSSKLCINLCRKQKRRADSDGLVRSFSVKVFLEPAERIGNRLWVSSMLEIVDCAKSCDWLNARNLWLGNGYTLREERSDKGNIPFQ